MYTHINNYSNSVTNNSKINNIQNLKKTINFTDDNTFLLKQVIVIILIHTT